MAPSFPDLTYFLEVAETKNISRAAERLGITQPSLSAAMMRLEDAVGTSLLIRGRAGVQLTKAGKELLGRGRVLLSSWEQLRSDINRAESGLSGQYIIGCHPSVALYSLKHFLPQLIHQYPDLEIKLRHDLSRKITERVISFEVDFGIVVNPVRHPDLIIKELCTDDVMFWTAQKPSATQSLAGSKGVLICDPDLIQTQKLLRSLQKTKIVFKRVIHSSSLEVIADLVASGVGVGILPRRVATNLTSYKLKPADEKLPTFRDRICLVYRVDAQKTKGSQIIIDAIKKEMGV